MKNLFIILITLLLLSNLLFSAEENSVQQSQPDTIENRPVNQNTETNEQPKIDAKLYTRVRYRFQYNNEKYYQTTLNNSKGISLEKDLGRERQRIRAIIGTSAKIGDQVELNLALVTGNDDNTRSLNQTLGSGGNFGEYFIGVNIAEIKLHFLSKALTFGFGKFEGPYLSGGLVTTGDLRLDGLYQKFNIKLSNIMDLGLNLGEFVFIGDSQNNNGSKKTSRWLLVPQLFYKAKFGNLNFIIASGIFFWTARTNNFANEQKYKIFNVFTKFDFKLGNLPFEIKIDFAYNFGKKPANETNPDGYNLDSKRLAILGLITIGKLDKQWDWVFCAGIWHSQSLSLMPSVADDDFVIPYNKNEPDEGSTGRIAGSASIPLAIIVKAGLVVLPNTNFNIDFIYYKKTDTSWTRLPGTSEYTQGWLIKLNLETRF